MKWLVDLTGRLCLIALFIAFAPSGKSQGLLLQPGDVVEGYFTPSDFQAVNETDPFAPSFYYRGFTTVPIGANARFHIDLFANQNSVDPFTGQDIDIIGNTISSIEFDGYAAQNVMFADLEGKYRFTYYEGSPITLNGVRFDVYDGQAMHRAFVTAVPEPSTEALILLFTSLGVAFGVFRRLKIAGT